MKLTRVWQASMICLILMIAVSGVNGWAAAWAAAPSGRFTLGLYQGVRFSDHKILASKDPAADLTVSPRYKGYVVYAALEAKKLREFESRPNLTGLSGADVAQYGELVFGPAAGYYYVLQANDNRYYLCKLEKFENQGKAATYWKLTFSYEEIYLGNQGPLSPPKNGITHAKKVYPDGSSYEGDFVNGEFQGKGILESPDGHYEGGFSAGKFEGRGYLRLTNGATYEGDFAGGNFHGIGKLNLPDGSSYEGLFVNGKPQGQGIIRFPDKSYYKGDFVAGQCEGQGSLFDANGKLLKKGVWVNNEFVGAQVETNNLPETSAPLSPPSVNATNVSPGKKVDSDDSAALYFFSSAYGKFGNYVRLNLRSMALEPLGFKGDDLTVSPDGKYLVYLGSSSTLHAHDLKSDADKEFTRERVDYGEPLFISNHLFAFLKYQSNEMKTSLCIKSVLDGQEKQLPHLLPDKVSVNANISYVPPLRNDLPFIMAVGNRLYLISAKAVTVLYQADSPADHLRYPSVSPDGKKVLFVSDFQKGLWVINLDGSGLRQLTDRDCQFSSWSPDGKNIAFTGAESGERSTGSFTHRIWLMGADGSNPHQLQGADGAAISVMGRLVWR